MKWALSIVLLLLIGLIGGYAWHGIATDPELTHKAGWSALQGFEFDERTKPFVGSELRRTTNRRFAAVSIGGLGDPQGGPMAPPQATPAKAWVLLNEHASDKAVLIMPQFRSYKVSCATVARLPNAVPDLDSYVEKRLTAICS